MSWGIVRLPRGSWEMFLLLYSPAREGYNLQTSRVGTSSVRGLEPSGVGRGFILLSMSAWG